MTKIYSAPAFEKRLQEIEDFLFQQSEFGMGLLDSFWNEYERAISFLKENPNTPGPHPQTGDQSWPFMDGRFRLFFKSSTMNNEPVVYLLDIIDNRQLNKRIYPENSLPTYWED